MSKKLLTDDLIIEKLNDKGIEEPGHLDKVEMIDILEEHFGCKLIFGDWPTYADFWFYTSQTADSYDVYVAATHDSNPNLYEEVYYYENDWLSELPEQITYGNTVYLDSDAEDSYEFTDALESAYEDYWNDKKQEVEDELIEEGYEWEDE
tara:strand:- start:480 stop:929 length:450 start_codon:yes stop_codon:yes gene_type:complete